VSFPPDPLAALSDEALNLTQVSLRLVCGRNKAVLRDKHRTRFCFLAQLLDTEAGKRGLPSPTPPYHA